jgi:hypothetical protein
MELVDGSGVSGMELIPQVLINAVTGQVKSWYGTCPVALPGGETNAHACGLSAEGNCACAIARLESHVRRGVLVAPVPIATLALELPLSTCGGEYL